MKLREFMTEHYRHFNAAVVVDAARAWEALLDDGGMMMLTLAGAMSTAELGRSLAAMIRAGKVHAITCTGANLEEDVFNLVAHDHYERLPRYRDLTPQDEQRLLERKLNRVTDTCIPEEEAMRRVEAPVTALWKEWGEAGRRENPAEFLKEVLRRGALEKYYQIDPKNSWMLAATEMDIPIFVPGWEDSSLGNNAVAEARRGVIPGLGMFKSGLEQMNDLIDWYKENGPKKVGFFQIGGGIAGDFPICVVPLITQDLFEEAPPWAYFCQISDSTTSYGSYSGAPPNEKITWGKLTPKTPRFVIESDATIVAPLVFGYLLDW